MKFRLTIEADSFDDIVEQLKGSPKAKAKRTNKNAAASNGKGPTLPASEALPDPPPAVPPTPSSEPAKEESIVLPPKNGATYERSEVSAMLGMASVKYGKQAIRDVLAGIDALPWSAASEDKFDGVVASIKILEN